MEQDQSVHQSKHKLRSKVVVFVAMLISFILGSVCYDQVWHTAYGPIILFTNLMTKHSISTLQPLCSLEVVNASKFVTFAKFDGRLGLGNQMFMFAALFYVGNLTQREVVLFNGHSAETLEKYFDLRVRKISPTCPCFQFTEQRISYDKRIETEISRFAAENSSSILLSGYFQSWKYVEPVERILRPHLKFRSHISAHAEELLRNITPPGWKKGFTRVGVHNRRGDFLAAWNFGLTTAPESYFPKAMQYFCDRFSPVQFIVISQDKDKDWTTKYVKLNSTADKIDITYVFGHSAGEDMAILARCNHVIVSTGTFGWWSSWLADGKTVYYTHYPRKGSFMDTMLKPADYFPNDWISMARK